MNDPRSQPTERDTERHQNTDRDQHAGRHHHWLLFGACMIGVPLFGLVSLGVALPLSVAVVTAYAIWHWQHGTRTGSHLAIESTTPSTGTDRDRPRDALDLMLADGRYALLLRPTVTSMLSPERRGRAREALQEAMGVVPEGLVGLAPQVGRPEDRDRAATPDGTSSEVNRTMLRIGAIYLDRFAVTNAQFQRFVEAGAYEQMDCWPIEIWPAVLDFVDETGEPGPHSWKQGAHPPGKGRHPVTGISWYEASAYANWVGKRLPTEAEWVKAGSWPSEISEGRIAERRFPWGDSMDPTRANLWCSGQAETMPVDEYARGMSVGGIYQLIGNVWEWTSGAIDASPSSCATEADGALLTGPMNLLHGGAFDTYFESQATCHFQSADRPTTRRHNIGFRCAIPVDDVVLVDIETALPLPPATADWQEDPAIPTKSPTWEPTCEAPMS